MKTVRHFIACEVTRYILLQLFQARLCSIRFPFDVGFQNGSEVRVGNTHNAAFHNVRVGIDDILDFMRSDIRPSMDDYLSYTLPECIESIFIA